MTDHLERIEVALGAMASAGPRGLEKYLEKPGPDFASATPEELEKIYDTLFAPDPNSVARLRFSNLLRSWDNTKVADWAGDTARNTTQRRLRIHERLQSGERLAQRIDTLIPYYHLDEPLIIAEQHQDWYDPKPGIRDYYWSTYVRYLRERRGWTEASLLNLDNHTRAIVECLTNPESAVSYASRGLVMGYVQSGKTANFTGVVARAADAGYRLIIVLAGTWNILRNQTQRRFDKELLGKELLMNDDMYTLHEPPDWVEFLEHGTDPVELGQFTWQRLTRPDIDFQRLRAAIDNLEFERSNKAAPIYDSSNLHALPVKLLVIKKHSGILHNLVKDLRLIRTRLADLPTLIIDDESDQAGLNTVDPNPKKKKVGAAERSKTNLRIVDLLGLFPRGQYVGYTATPYANAVVDPDDPEDLFPKDFILPLDRPSGYMGVSDFFDPTTEYADLNKDDYSQSEIAYIRRVESEVGSDNEEVKQALRSYVLAGGIKLFRLTSSAERYKPEHFKHHTMLVHTSQLRGEMATVAGRVKDLWDECAFNSPSGLRDLEELWRDDNSKVSRADGKELVPGTFAELIPHLSEAIKRIEKGPKIYFVVNSDTSEAPDFGAAPVWKIVIGGNKLSRGYTIEGLTVSYYRRVAGTADTLMQMGRWFGFRPGYQDLVRVFLGVRDGRRGDSDLVSLFKEVCRMEEKFRNDIRRYVRRPGVPRITPAQIPPLISVSGSLPPTARNKMFNARLVSKNFGGDRSMHTQAPTKPAAMDENVNSMTQLLRASTGMGILALGGTVEGGTTVSANAFVFETATIDVIAFLISYRWLESDYTYPNRPADATLQIEFLEKQKHEIESWLVVAPQRESSFGPALPVKGIGEMTVKERKRVEGRGFQVFGEPAHRTIAEYLTGIPPGRTKLSRPSPATKGLFKPHRGVILLYPVRPEQKQAPSIGFEVFFPENNLQFDVNFTVRRKADSSKIVV
jgi:hypothetical protein